MRRAGGDVEESDLRERRKQAQVGQQMSLKAIETQRPRINKAESDHRREKRFGSEEQRKLVDKIALCGLRMDGAAVPFRGQEGLTDVQFPAEVIHLVGFGFEIAISEVGQSEIKDHQPRANVLDGMLAAMAQVLPTNCSIDRA